MKKLITIVIVLFVTLNAKTAMAALPPQVEADRQMIAAETAAKEQRWDDAVVAYEAVEATGIKKRPANFHYFYGRALIYSGQYAKGKEIIEAYLSSAGTGAKYYREALVSLNEIEEGKKRLAEDQAMEAMKEAQNTKLKAAWVSMQTSLTEVPPSGEDNCANLKGRIKNFSKSARNIDCKCEIKAVDHPAWKDFQQDYCQVEWQANTILDGNSTYSGLDINNSNNKARTIYVIRTRQRR